MPIPITQILLPAALQTSREPLLQQLKPGQILQGTALSENINGRLSLQIGVTRLIAQTQLSVRPGQALTLQVVSADKTPELRVLLPVTLESLKAAALKSLLPRQQPLPEAFQALAQVVRAAAREPAFPSAVREQAQALLQRLPSPESPAFRSQLQRAIVDSGLFTEPRLLRGVAEPGDMKLLLTRLMERIVQLLPENRLQPLPLEPKLLAMAPKSPPEPLPDSGIKLLIGLLKHLDGAVARMQTHQLASLPREEGTQPVWQFELPVRNGERFDLFHIRIGRESGAGAVETETAWSLTLHMELEELGPMRVHLRLQGESLSTLIWSQRPDTDRRVRERLGELRNAYEERGLTVQRLEARVGSVEDPHAIPRDGSLLYEKV